MAEAPLITRSLVAQAILGLGAGVPLLIEVSQFAREAGAPEAGDVVESRASAWLVDAVSMAGVVVGMISVWSRRSAPLPKPSATFVSGIAAIGGGMALRQWAHGTLGRFHLGDVTIHHDHELVVEGPYAHIRHPLYAATLAVFSGIGFALGTRVSAAAGFVFPTAVLAYRIKIEEQAIESSDLGPAYAEYASTRARLLPGIW